MSVLDFVKLYVFPTGRRLFAHGEVLRVAQARDLTRIITHVSGAIAHDQDAAQLRLKRRAEPTTRLRYSPDAQRRDVELDRSVAGLDAFLLAQIQIYGPDSPRGRAAAKLRQALFPDGVGEITRLSYVQEHAAVEGMLRRAGDPEFAETMTLLPGLDDVIRQVRERNAALLQAISHDKSVPTTSELRAASSQGQKLLCETVVLIFAEYIGATDLTARNELLAPILRQQEALRDLRRRRRAVSDVNPDTGEELPTTDEDTGVEGGPDESET